jgi:hypothetical protein
MLVYDGFQDPSELSDAQQAILKKLEDQGGLKTGAPKIRGRLDDAILNL